MAKLPPKIKATIDENALKVATRFFNASTRQVLDELLQNSRRAGASQVDIVVSEDMQSFSITDNGSGIACLEDLLRFGGSGWNQSVSLKEDSAGMGFYCLSQLHSKAVTRTKFDARSRSVDLDPDVFTGDHDAEIRYLDDVGRVGTSISVTLLSPDLNLKKIIAKVTQYYPIPVSLNGEDVERDTFPMDALYKKSMPYGTLYITQHTSRSPKNIANFFGLPIALPSIHLTNVYGKKYIAHVDLNDTSRLRLTLPTRADFVQDAAYEELCDDMRRFLFEFISTLDEHTLSYRDWVIAKKMGIELPQAAPKLRPFCLRDDYSSFTITSPPPISVSPQSHCILP